MQGSTVNAAVLYKMNEHILIRLWMCTMPDIALNPSCRISSVSLHFLYAFSLYLYLQCISVLQHFIKKCNKFNEKCSIQSLGILINKDPPDCTH